MVLYGPNISFKKDEDIFEILSDDGEEIFINNDELLNYGGVKLALREKISINDF